MSFLRNIVKAYNLIIKLVTQLSLLIRIFCPKTLGKSIYLSGGFITRYHGSRYDNHDEVDAIQIEFPRTLRMGGDEVVNDLGKASGKIISKFYKTWYL